MTNYVIPHPVAVSPFESVPAYGLDSHNSLFTVGDRALLESISQELAKRVVS